MDIFVPDYYEDFSCIGSDCNDNCCIGWEIDIDSVTLEKYLKLDGPLGDELRTNITRSEDGSDCFTLASGDRCPFLNDNNLCRLILSGGEDMLCEICSLHPRFREWFGERCEMGIGLCCEEAARIIINSDKPFGLHILRSEDSESEPLDTFRLRLLDIRSDLFKIIENGKDIFSVCQNLLFYSAEVGNDLTGYYPNKVGMLRSRKFTEKAVSMLLSLEPINDRWNDVCNRLSADIDLDFSDTAKYKNILSYFIFRYFLKAEPDEIIFLKPAFAIFSAQMIALIQRGCFMSILDAACLWSKEVEYSSENLEAVFNFLYEEYCE
ncbi:MAG: flagellin lysine-N-methylase [Oscillospiraceae bacterium]|nr:flagellin lysine-N-methylase [Oscillospiraceae bacterium]